MFFFELVLTWIQRQYKLIRFSPILLYRLKPNRYAAFERDFLEFGPRAQSSKARPVDSDDDEVDQAKKELLADCRATYPLHHHQPEQQQQHQHQQQEGQLRPQQQQLKCPQPQKRPAVTDASASPPRSPPPPPAKRFAWEKRRDRNERALTVSRNQLAEHLARQIHLMGLQEDLQPPSTPNLALS